MGGPLIERPSFNFKITPPAAAPTVPTGKPLTWSVVAVQTQFARATRHGAEPLRPRLRFTPLRYAGRAAIHYQPFQATTLDKQSLSELGVSFLQFHPGIVCLLANFVALKTVLLTSRA
jgi:hypothetical protein